MPTNPEKWMEEVHTILKEAESLWSEFQAVTEWVWGNVVASDLFPKQILKELAPILQNMSERIQKIESEANASVERYNNRPKALALGGYALSEDEFYLLQAVGVFRGITKGLGLSPVDDFEAFSMMHYEDERLRTMINPKESPRREGRIGLRIGRPPEELSRAALRPEQQKFFLKYMPEVYERFAE